MPRLFIREMTRKGDIVLDPMMGSGTTLIESLMLDRNAIGCDIDPLSLRIAAAKLKSIDRMQASGIGRKILEKARNNLKNNPHFLEEELKTASAERNSSLSTTGLPKQLSQN
ncbi:MAG: site-specific DNA-methyltransferase [Desulfobacteraceae bacterium]|nr:site-specific DNA-methyltransferase [Desulfobacteraceae bacterium]